MSILSVLFIALSIFHPVSHDGRMYAPVVQIVTNVRPRNFFWDDHPVMNVKSDSANGLGRDSQVGVPGGRFAKTVVVDGGTLLGAHPGR